MPDLIIDGHAVSVPKGTMVIEAAEQCGVMIPRFCWHKALGPAGACRMCAVMFVAGPVKGLEMSCMTPAVDGMVVETFHPEAVAFRRRIIELLMINHPHDCPVCDEGGQCLLQDETISGNHALRRFPGRKRTYLDQDLGPFIQHEMNRCIHCYRCARFYQEYCGYRDFGPMQNANRVYFGRFADGPLESPFSGNLADLCPTGTLTDKTARYKSRRWDCQRAPSICPHCSLGCNTVALSRHRAIARIEARENAAVNGFFLCDRGRFSHGFESRPDRPRQATVDGRPTAMADAVCTAAGRLAETVARHGPAAVAVIGSVRSSMETQAALILLARVAGWPAPVFFPTRGEQTAVRLALAAATPQRARSMAELATADAILCLGVSPLCDAPMLALALRQATRAGGRVFVADPRSVGLPLPFVHLPAAPKSLPAVLGVVTGLDGDAALAAQKRLPLAPQLWPLLESAANVFGAAKRPAIVFAPALAAHLPTDPRFGLFPAPSGPNAVGAALLADADAMGLEDVVQAVEAGRIKALIVTETDLAVAGPRFMTACAGLETLIVCDHLPTPTVAGAAVFLPSATIFEAGGTFCNNEGRLQMAAPVQSPGEPVARDGHGDHPPRAYDRKLPGTDPRPASALLAALAEELDLLLPHAPLPALAAGIPGLADVDWTRLPPEGLRPVFAAAQTPPGSDAPAVFATDPGLTVVFSDDLFGTDALGRYAALPGVPAATPEITLQADDAEALGFADGNTAAIASGDRFEAATVRVRHDMARGVIVMPRRPQFAGLPPTLGPCDIRRR
jgi:NADH-quinone oxidoreductase subunit G